MQVISHTALVSDTAAGSSASMFPSSTISDDGRYMVFYSEADNLLAGQTPGLPSQLYLYDRLAQTFTLVSHAAGSSTSPGDFGAGFPADISADGRFVVFESGATNLVSGQTGGGGVFLYDITTGAISLVSHTGDGVTSGGGFSPVISADGSYVAFRSWASNLVAGQNDTNGHIDVFLYERATGAVRLVSHVVGDEQTTGNGSSGVFEAPELSDIEVSISGDGKYVAFTSLASNLAGQDENSTLDVFLYDRDTRQVSLVSKVAGMPTPTAGNDLSFGPVFSRNGNALAFVSYASNLAVGQMDSNATADVFRYDLTTGTNRLVSNVGGSSTTAGNDRSYRPVVSADGRYIAFTSYATNLPASPDDQNGDADVFLFDSQLNTIGLVSRAAGTNAAADGFSSWPRISLDGRFIVYVSSATNLVNGSPDTNGQEDVILFDRDAGASPNTLVSAAAGSGTTGGNGPSFVGGICGNGDYVALDSPASNLVTGTTDSNGTYDVFLYDRVAATKTLVSRRDPASPSLTSRDGLMDPEEDTAAPLRFRQSSVSDDGRYIAFTSIATDLVDGQIETQGEFDVFLRDRLSGTTSLISHAFGSSTASGAGKSWKPIISGDGNFVAFISNANDLVPGVSGPRVYVYSRNTGTITNVGPTVFNGSVPAISYDGRYVAFSSSATNLVAGQSDTNGLPDVFLFDREMATSRLVSHASSSTTTTGNNGADVPVISADGNFIAFESFASNHVAGQTGAGGVGVFLYKLEDETIRLVSRTADSTTTNGFGNRPSISDDGRFVAFQGGANLVNGQTGGGGIFLYDRSTDVNTLVSHTASSSTSSAGGTWPVVSGDGQFVTFVSTGTNLATSQSDNNAGADVFLYDRSSGTVSLVSHASGSSTTTGAGASGIARLRGAGLVTNLGISDNGRFVAYVSSATNLVAGQSTLPVPSFGGATNIFLYDRTTGEARLASHASGSNTTTGSDQSDLPLISGNGNVVVFASMANNVASGDYNGRLDLFGFVIDPTVTVNGPVNGVPGQSRTFIATGNHPIPANQASLSYTWSVTKNGAVYQTGSGSSFSFTPNDITDPSGADTYAVSVMVSDQDGGTAVAGQTSLVTTIAVQGDDLAVGGTLGSDTIAVNAAGGGALDVVIGGVSQGVFNVPGQLLLFGQDGGDQFTINATGAGGLTADGQGGADVYTVNFGGLAGPVLVSDSGTVGADNLRVNGTNDAEGITKTFDGLTRHVHRATPTVEDVYATGIESATINGRAGDDRITDPGSDTVLEGGEGNDTIIITATLPGQLLADGGEGSDSIIVHFGSLLGAVTVLDSGAGGGDTLTVLGTPGDEVIVQAGSQLSRGTETITLGGGIEALTVDGGGGEDQFSIQGNPELLATLQGIAGLAIVGTPNNDHIAISPGAGPGEVEAWLNGASLGTYTPTGQLVAYGRLGDDDIQVAGSITLSAWLHGEGGHDRLKGGAGDDVLLGGDGDDLLVGGNGRDLLIGGFGADRLVGNAADDILIAGTTDYDADFAALCAVTAEWTRTDADFATRVEHLKNGGGSNGSILLNDLTVHDDSAADVLTGCEGQDWFLFNPDGAGGAQDQATDLKTFEAMFAEDLDFIMGP